MQQQQFAQTKQQSQNQKQQHFQQQQIDAVVAAVSVSFKSVSLFNDDDDDNDDVDDIHYPKSQQIPRSNYYLVPKISPSPFETSVWAMPSVVLIVLSYLGNPADVCRQKCVNKFCRRIVKENEYILMKNAVRAGGMSDEERPKFWLWVTLVRVREGETNVGCGFSRDKYDCESSNDQKQEAQNSTFHPRDDFSLLEQNGRKGKWHSTIQKDIHRSFGNMPPHKTGALLRGDSIIRALGIWGKNRFIKRGQRCCEKVKTEKSYNHERWDNEKFKDDCSVSRGGVFCGDDYHSVDRKPTGTVSDWGGLISCADTASNLLLGKCDGISSHQKSSYVYVNTPHNCLPDDDIEDVNCDDQVREMLDPSDLALSGDYLNNDDKVLMQQKLSSILHGLAAAHEGVGYCQGMDYIVSHLMRVLHKEILRCATNNTLPPIVRSASRQNQKHGDNNTAVNSNINNKCNSKECRVMEETVFHVMDSFFLYYNLRHMYWPELRCLKRCCKVFEILVVKTLPVLADHFEHHELNIGFFVLGWFQTLFLYLPSMPSATVCHIWDIWLVERSFKIFFRVGTAILFLSQPILLNHELEGMMTYLNTFPDATLLNPDILIECALQIKVTNRMLLEIEKEVSDAEKAEEFIEQMRMEQQGIDGSNYEWQ